MWFFKTGHSKTAGILILPAAVTLLSKFIDSKDVLDS
jgi:hypothetical protein